jgi:hypothetical protein
MRDPRLDPRRGDWLTDGKTDLRVDSVERGSVYFARFTVGEEFARSLAQVPTEEWVRLASEDGVEVTKRAADDALCPNCVTPWKCNGPHEVKP